MAQVTVEKIQTLTGHKDCLYTVEGIGQQHEFFSSGGDGIVAKWDLKDPEVGKLVIKVTNSVYAMHYLPEDDHLVVGQNFEGIHLVNLQDNKEIASAKITDSQIFDIKHYQNMLFSACGDGTIVVNDAKTLGVVKKWKPSDKSARCLAINPVDRHLAIGFSDNTVRIYDLKTLELRKEITEHTNSVFSVQYSLDFQYLLSTGRDAHLKIWDVNKEYSQHNNIVAHMYAINNIQYAPSGDYFATCSMDKSIKVWDAHSFRLLKVIDRARHAGHATSVNKLWWSGYQDLLVSASDDRSLSVWSIEIKA